MRDITHGFLVVCILEFLKHAGSAMFSRYLLGSQILFSPGEERDRVEEGVKETGGKGSER